MRVFYILLALSFLLVKCTVELDCNRSWPSLALFMPIKTHHVERGNVRYYELETVFFRTFLFFWPTKLSNTSVILAYDSENENTKYIKMVKDTIKDYQYRVPGGITTVGSDAQPYYSKGYDRQQFVQFWGDNFTNTEYIGFVDSDSAFMTRIDREDIFEGIRPVINARSGIHTSDHVLEYWAMASHDILGIKQPFSCMSYFPVVIKTSHLKELRDFIEERNNKSFNLVFLEFSQRSYSQYCVMCTYLWHYHRDEYVWYVHSETPSWDGINPPPTRGLDGNLSQFTEEMKRPKPRVATHAGYRRSSSNGLSQINSHRINMNLFMQQGVCISPPFPRTEEVCKTKDPWTYYYEMHHFEYVDYNSLNSRDSLNHEAMIRYNRTKHCTHEWDPYEMGLIMKPAEEMKNGGWS